ncbi:MAG: hypothetical protein JWR20_1647 [Marmoricola sp.]|nr:hypothetical protein [Marmoricola sp.]
MLAVLLMTDTPHGGAHGDEARASVARPDWADVSRLQPQTQRQCHSTARS